MENNNSHPENLNTNENNQTNKLEDHINAELESTNKSEGVELLRSWLNKSFRVEMIDGRVLIGLFLCTDRDANLILGSCTEYLPNEETNVNAEEEPRMLGLVMIPGKHIVNIYLDWNQDVTKQINIERIT